MSIRSTQFTLAKGTFLGFLLLFIFILFRTTGIHCDENNYIYLARDGWMGTTRMDGKPPFYYSINYLIFYGVGAPLGQYKIFSLYFVYMLLTAWSISFLSMKAFADNRRRWTLYAILLFNPFTLYNGTQVMMETLLLASLSFLIGCLFLSKQEFGKFLPKKYGVLLVIAAAFISVAIKITVLPAIVLISLAFLLVNPRIALVPLMFGSGLSYGLTMLSLKILRAPRMPFGGIYNLFNFSHVLGALKYWPEYMLIWFFFICPSVLIGATAVYFFRSLRIESSLNTVVAPRTLLFLGWLSILFSLVFVCMTNYDVDLNQFRWQFPLYWAASVFLSIVFASARTWVLSLAFLLTIPVSAGLISNSVDRYFFWPTAVTDQIQGSDLATYKGLPFMRWYLFDTNPRKNVCIFMPEQRQIQAHLLARQFAKLIFENPIIFREEGYQTFLSCTGPKMIYVSALEQYEPACSGLCDEGNYNYHWRSCQWQELSYVKPRQKQLVTLCMP